MTRISPPSRFAPRNIAVILAAAAASFALPAAAQSTSASKFVRDSVERVNTAEPDKVGLTRGDAGTALTTTSVGVYSAQFIANHKPPTLAAVPYVNGVRISQFVLSRTPSDNALNSFALSAYPKLVGGAEQSSGGVLQSSRAQRSTFVSKQSLGADKGLRVAPNANTPTFRADSPLSLLAPTEITRDFGNGVATFGPGSIVRYSPDVQPEKSKLEYRLAMTPTPYYERYRGANPYQLVVGVTARF